MTIIDTNSLANTLDAVNETYFYGRSLDVLEKEQVAKWIAGQQGKPGAYANMFAPTERDFEEGIRVFTGEKITSGAATGHILGEEACRALILLKVSNTNIHNALEKASKGMLKALKNHSSGGIYCCGKCSASLWRHLAVGGLKDAESHLVEGLNALKQHRDDAGRWKRFPFYYTLLALNEIDLPQAVEEMQYTAKTCERCLKRTKKDNKYHQRRQNLLEQILAKC